MMGVKTWGVRAARSLGGALGATVAISEMSEWYDTSRHAVYARQQLNLRRARLQQQAEQPEESNDQTHALWLQSEPPKFPYVVAVSSADNPANVISALLGETDHVVGSPHEPTMSTIETLLVPVAPLDALIQRVAIQWQWFKMRPHGDVPVAFDPQRDALTTRLNAVLAALRTMSSHDADAEPIDETEKEILPDKFIFYLRDFDDWDDATTTGVLEWVHHVTSAGLAHVVLSTQASVTPAVLSDWQRIHKVPQDTNFVALLLRPATRACDRSAALDKLRLLSERFELNLRGLDVQHDTEEEQEKADGDGMGFALPTLPTEAQLIVETVGDWWKDLEWICRALAIRGLGDLESTDDRLVRVQQVCDEYERDAQLAILSTLGIFDLDADVPVPEAEPEIRERRISALQAWKCLEVVTGVGDDAQILGPPETLLRRDTGKPLNCVHPVEALLPFNQRVHGDATFFKLVDQGILYLRPKSDVEIGVVPCDAKSLVAPCWVETRPLIKRAFAKLWRDDGNYAKVLELERFEDNYKMSQELNLFEQEIHERRKELDAQTREFIMLQPTMKEHQVAQRKAELSLLELEIQSRVAYLERLRSLLD